MDSYNSVDAFIANDEWGVTLWDISDLTDPQIIDTNLEDPRLGARRDGRGREQFLHDRPALSLPAERPEQLPGRPVGRRHAAHAAAARHHRDTHVTEGIHVKQRQHHEHAVVLGPTQSQRPLIRCKSKCEVLEHDPFGTIRRP